MDGDKKNCKFTPSVCLKAMFLWRIHHFFKLSVSGHATHSNRKSLKHLNTVNLDHLRMVLDLLFMHYANKFHITHVLCIFNVFPIKNWTIIKHSYCIYTKQHKVKTCYKSTLLKSVRRENWFFFIIIAVCVLRIIIIISCVWAWTNNCYEKNGCET